MFPSLILVLVTSVTALIAGDPVPVTSCCPEGSFLAIDDVLGDEAKQRSDGTWPRPYVDFYPFQSEETFSEEIFTNYYNQRSRLPEHGGGREIFGRHEFVTGFKCVPTFKNQLPSLNGYPPFSPALPYFIDGYDEAHPQQGASRYSGSGKVVMRPLDEGQTLKSIGTWTPNCSPRQLSTIILGTGEANSYKSPRMRLTQSGDLVAQKFNFLGLGGLRRVSELYWWGGEKLEGVKGNLTGPETKVDVKFCVTWSHDPRTKLEDYALPPQDGRWDKHPKAEEELDISRPPRPGQSPSADLDLNLDLDLDQSREVVDVRESLFDFDPPASNLSSEELHARRYWQKPAPLLLELVFCDPCKEKVFCHFLSTTVWWEIYSWVNPLKCTPGQYDYNCDHVPGFSWRYDHPLLVYLRNYLDEDQDGSVSQKEFVDKKALPLISSIFNSLDQNSDNIVELSEAWMENVLSPKFIRILGKELFKFGDINRDNFLSNEDIPEAFKPGSFELRTDNRLIGRRWGSTYFEFKMKFNKSLDFCILTDDPDLQQKCSKYMMEFLTAVDRDNDDQLSFVETNDLFMSVLKFFGDASCRVTVDGLIEGLRKLGEPREVTEAVRRYLVPVLETLPRRILKSLVQASDANKDGKTEVKELEDFSDFDLVAWTWPGFLRSVKDDLKKGMRVCRREDCFPEYDADPFLVLGYFANPNVAERLLRALFNQRDFSLGESNTCNQL